MVKIYSADEAQEVVESDAGYAAPTETAESTSIDFEISSGYPSRRSVRDLASQNMTTIAGILGFIAFAGICWMVWFFFIATHTTDVTVESFRWSRQVEVIQYMPRHREGWSRPPADAYNKDKDWRYHYSERVLDHYETRSYSCGTTDHPQTCKSRDAVYRYESVYDWYYTYTVDRWDHSRWIVASAFDHSTPHWPDLSEEHFDNTDVIGNEQLSGKKYESYVVNVRANNQSYTKDDLTLETWLSIDETRVYAGHITRSGNLRSIDW